MANYSKHEGTPLVSPRVSIDDGGMEVQIPIRANGAHASESSLLRKTRFAEQSDVTRKLLRASGWKPNAQSTEWPRYVITVTRIAKTAVSAKVLPVALSPVVDAILDWLGEDKEDVDIHLEQEDKMRLYGVRAFIRVWR
jgi:hypothetical protein